LYINEVVATNPEWKEDLLWNKLRKIVGSKENVRSKALVPRARIGGLRLMESRIRWDAVCCKPDCVLETFL
jgi:hypothetical protein